MATISRLLKIIGLFCRISSPLQGSVAKEIHNFKEPTNRSHPIDMSHGNDMWYSWDRIEMTCDTREICCSALQQKLHVISFLMYRYTCVETCVYRHMYHDICLDVLYVCIDLSHGRYVSMYEIWNDIYGTPEADLMYTIRHFCCNTLQQISCVPYVVSVATHCNRSHVYHTSFLCDLTNISFHFCVTHPPWHMSIDMCL